MNRFVNLSNGKRRTLLLSATILLSWAAASPAHALFDETATTAIDITSTHYQSAYKLADLQQGGTKLSPRLVANMRSQMNVAFASDPDIRFLETEYPGVTEAMLDAVIPIAVRQTEDSMPVFFDRLARLYMANLSPSEIQDMIGFVDTASYDRLRTAIEDNFDLSEILAADVDSDVTSAQLNNMVVDSATKTVPGLSKKDQMALVIMSKHPSFGKFAALRSQRMRLETEWTNESSPEEDAEIEAKTTAVIEKFTGLDLSNE